jgi:hypothetical protein
MAFNMLGSEHSPQATEGLDREDYFMDLLVKMMARLPDYATPEFVTDAEAFPECPACTGTGRGHMNHHIDGDKTTARWLKTCMYNANRQKTRDWKRHRRILGSASADPRSWLSPGRRTASAEAQALAHLEHLENVRRIARLPGKLYQVAMLRYEGWEPGEIAGILGIDRSTVWRRLGKIKSDRIRKVLGL